MADEYTSLDGWDRGQNQDQANQDQAQAAQVDPTKAEFPGDAHAPNVANEEAARSGESDVRDQALAGDTLTGDQVRELSFGERMATGNLTAEDDVARARGQQGGDVDERELAKRMRADTEELRRRTAENLDRAIRDAEGRPAEER